jgi:hypothetical protein
MNELKLREAEGYSLNLKLLLVMKKVITLTITKIGKYIMR